VRDSRQRGIAHGWILPILFLTFMFGPAGWVSYLALRALLRRLDVGQGRRLTASAGEG
jgi:hypothetical protein